MSDFYSIKFENNKLYLIDQTKLPFEENYIATNNLERVAEAIEKLEVRGAPAIGIAAAYGIVVAMKDDTDETTFNKAFERLAKTRPTAVNLFFALDEMKKTFLQFKNSPELYTKLLEKAKAIHQSDIKMCNDIGANGLPIFTKKMNVLTHCNTGALATGGSGTAFSVIKKAYENNLVNFVYADETRPLLQGSRLTAFELAKNKIPFAIITDSTAAFLMQQGKVDLVITGADRITSNGDSANKIGTYSLAVLCKHHNIPFYIAAPNTTFDYDCTSGKEIIIEERDKAEISKIKNVQVTKEEYDIYSPAFDVTPNELITGIITETKLYKYPFNFKK